MSIVFNLLQPQRFLGLVVYAVFCVLLALPLAAMAVPEGTACTTDPEDIEYGDLIICSIDPVGDTHAFRFHGTASETITIQLSETGGGRAGVLPLSARWNRGGVS